MNQYVKKIEIKVSTMFLYADESMPDMLQRPFSNTTHKPLKQIVFR